MELIKRLSDRAEFIVIFIIVFSFPIFNSIYSMAAFLKGYASPIIYDNYSLINILELEVLTGIAAGFILRARYWKFSDFNINTEWFQTLIGFGLFAADFLLHFFTILFLSIIYDLNALPSPDIVIREISPAVAVIISIVNPFFEEFFVVGYIVQSLHKKHDAVFVITVSAVVRFLYHLYQGPFAIYIFFLGILHAFVYWRWKSLWPLIISHCILNYMVFGLGVR